MQHCTLGPRTVGGMNHSFAVVNLPSFPLISVDCDLLRSFDCKRSDSVLYKEPEVWIHSSASCLARKSAFTMPKNKGQEITFTCMPLKMLLTKALCNRPMFGFYLIISLCVSLGSNPLPWHCLCHALPVAILELKCMKLVVCIEFVWPTVV